MLKRNVTAIPLYFFVLVIAICVVLFIDKKSKEKIPPKITQTQAVASIKSYYPELQVYQKTMALENNNYWLVAFFGKNDIKCFKVDQNGNIFKTGESNTTTATGKSFGYTLCQ